MSNTMECGCIVDGDTVTLCRHHDELNAIVEAVRKEPVKIVATWKSDLHLHKCKTLESWTFGQYQIIRVGDTYRAYHDELLIDFPGRLDAMSLDDAKYSCEWHCKSFLKSLGINAVIERTT